MTGDPTGVQTMKKKKIETVIHLEFGMNNLFLRFFFFSFFKFKYNPS